MEKLGKFWLGPISSDGAKFEPSDKSLHESLLYSRETGESFRIYRIVREGDSSYEGIIKSMHLPVSEVNYRKKEHGGLELELLAYEPYTMEHPRLRIFDNYFELDLDKKLIVPSKRHIGRSFGQDAIPDWYYIGTEDDFIQDLGYDFLEQ
ncbi:MAG: hypothetical protein KAT28_05515 [Candidatus Aenigmarchaeota archaeon]|nr:hypothetical protein [Candidatus Aenigmarchaeota archaeon]